MFRLKDVGRLMQEGYVSTRSHCMQSNFVFVLMGPWGKSMILRLFVKAPLVAEEQPSESVWMKPFPSVTI